MVKRIPRHVIARNRNAAEGDANALYYNAVERGQYTLDQFDGRGPRSIDLQELIREHDGLMPADRRRMFDLEAGKSMRIDRFDGRGWMVLACQVQGRRP